MKLKELRCPKCLKRNLRKVHDLAGDWIWTTCEECGLSLGPSDLVLPKTQPQSNQELPVGVAPLGNSLRIVSAAQEAPTPQECDLRPGIHHKVRRW